MKLKTFVQMMVMSCGILGLTACAALHKDSTDEANNSADVNSSAAGSGVQTSGVGDNSNFNGEGSVGGSRSLAKRTYYFEFDRSDVRASDKPAIFANADHLVAHPKAKVLLEGHTDPRGSREYNVALGERRANAVAEMLKSKGVNPSQIRVISYGAERLAVPGHSEEHYQQDRRVVLVYLRQ